jgi:hypothetical protein
MTDRFTNIGHARRDQKRKLLALLTSGDNLAANQFWIASDLTLDDFHEAMAMADRKKREDEGAEALGIEGGV